MSQAWIGDWYTRVKQRVRERGFTSATAFVQPHPTVSLRVLADELGEDDVAAAQLEKVLVDEAEESGAVERCARSLLVRRLHEELPEGWRTERDDSSGGSARRLISACTAVEVALPERYRDLFNRVDDALWEAQIPEGWLPAGPDDPILLEAFKHWNEPG